MSKRCFICGEVKPLDDFYTHKLMRDGHLNKCKECAKAYARKRDTRGIDIKRYRTNPNRYLTHKYYMMKRRCTKPIPKHESYLGRDLMKLDEWMSFCKDTMDEFMALYVQWQKSGYKRAQAPSIDRIDNSLGYVIGNVQWMTLSQNSRKHTR